jgi:hypothetical protein
VRSLASLILLVTSIVHADEPRAVLLIAPGVSRTAADEVAKDAGPRGLELAAPAPQAEPAAETLLAEIRPLYQDMKFGAAVKKLEAGRDELIANRLPTPGLLKALGEIELWLGACAFLQKDKTAANDHWALARLVAPEARPDRIFPPEVHKAFAAKQPAGKPVTVAVKLAPVDARLWIDGRRASAPVTAVPGLHLVVVERADQDPSTQILRVTKSAPEIAVSLQQAATPADALRQAGKRIRTGPLTRDEGIGVSAALLRPLWVVTEQGDKLVANRYASSDVTRPVDEVSAPAATLIDELCKSEKCVAPVPAVALVPTPNNPTANVVATQPIETTPKKPVWKKGWFWGVIGATVLVVAGAATGTALGLTAARDYDVRVR